MGTISTAIPTAEYEPLLAAVTAAADICTRLPPTEKLPGVGGFALVVLSRWAANAQAFILLRNASMLTDAYGVARIGVELAIMAAWAWYGGAAGDRFTTPAERVKALTGEANASTRVWFDEMKKRGAVLPGYDDTTQWGRALKSAARVGLPKIEQMANCSDATKDLYVFGYRGSSGSTHSAAWVLASHAAGDPPLRESRMLQDVFVTAMVIFDAASNMLEDERARRTATNLQHVIRERVAEATAAGRAALRRK